MKYMVWSQMRWYDYSKNCILKLQGLCLLAKIRFLLPFLNIVSAHCIFSGGKVVVSVFGEGYV